MNTQQGPPNQTDATNTTPAGQTRALAAIPSGVMDMMDKAKGEFQKALGSAIPVDYFLRLALTTIRKNPLVAASTPGSLMQCMMELAQIRLVLDSILGEAYIVPFWSSKAINPVTKKEGAYEATLMIGYRGLVKLARRNTQIINLTCDLVYERDRFVMTKGTNGRLEHEPIISGDRGAALGAYAYVRYQGGGEDYVFVDAPYLERVRKMSRGSDKPESPWNLWWEAQWKKTAIRQLMKLADLSPDVAEAIAKENLDEGAIDVMATVHTAAASIEPSKLTRAKKEDPAHRESQVPKESEPRQDGQESGQPPEQPSADKTSEKAKETPPQSNPADKLAPAKPAQMSAEELAKQNEALLVRMRSERKVPQQADLIPE